MPTQWMGMMAGLMVTGWTLFAADAQVFSPRQAKDIAWLSPTAMAVAPDKASLYIACADANRILVWDLSRRCITRSIELPEPPADLAVSPATGQLYITSATPDGWVYVVGPALERIVNRIAVGHTPVSPVLSPDGQTLYVCNRFDNSISVIAVAQASEISRIKVTREPIAAAILPTGKQLLVAHFLQDGRADQFRVACSVSVIDTVSQTVIKRISLPIGGVQCRDIRISPDGKYACVTHILARFHLPTTQVDRGWMNSNAMTLIDLNQLRAYNTVLLDTPIRGAANPWAIGWTADGARLLITHAGSHELSVIQYPELLVRLERMTSNPKPGEPNPIYELAATVPYDLSFLGETRQRVKLRGQGARSLAIVGSTAYVANYYSDNVNEIALNSPSLDAASLPLGPEKEPSQTRWGEMLFNDASICHQSWQSCASCHSTDGRVDALNWDLLNDGIGNPKNTRSLLFAHRTPPAMSMGVRETAETAVRAGLQSILFAERPEAEALAIDAYLKSLRPVASPYLENGRLSAAAKRGEKLFFDGVTRCHHCHKPALFTDLRHHDVGTRNHVDQPKDEFDTPALIELWRTAPYLHDGSATTVRAVMTTANRDDRHGKTSQLTTAQIEDLAAYLLSL